MVDIFKGGNPDPAICLLWFENLVINGTDCSAPWRELLDLMAEWWTPGRARPVLVNRSGGFCECGCGRRLNLEKAHAHHAIPRSHYKGAHRDSPAMLALIHPACHEAIHGRVGTGIDTERVNRVQAMARKRLPPWFDQSTTSARERQPRKRRRRVETLCQCGCGQSVGLRPINGFRFSCWEGQ